MSTLRLGKFAVLALATVGGTVQFDRAQDARQRIVRRPECAGCTVSFQRIGTLGGKDERRSLLGQLRHIEVDGAGRYWVSFHGNQPPAIYEATGVLLRPVGTLGDGPGELGPDALAVRIASDSMAVLDFRHRTIHVYGVHGALIRSAPLAVPPGGLQYLLTDAMTVVAGALRSRDQAGQPLHVFADTGTWIASFGTEVPVMRRNGTGVALLRIAGHAREAFWAVDPSRYILELWSSAGERLAAITRSAPWFRPEETVRYPTLDRPPQTLVAGIGEDGAGHLIVVATVPDDRWRESFGSAVRREARGDGTQGGAVRSVADFRKHIDTYIEVYDASSRVLLASVRRDEAFAYVLPGGLLVAAEPDGETLAIWKVRLIEPKP